MWLSASEGSAAAAAAAEASPLPIIPELDQTEDWEPRTDWFMRDVPISFETVVENVSAVRLSGCSMALRPSTRVPPVGISRLVLCRALCCTASLATLSAILVKHEHRRPHWRVAGSRGARLHGPAAAGLGLSMSCGSGSLSYLLRRPSYGYFTAVPCLLSCGTGDGPMPCQLYTSQGPRSSHQRE